MDTGVAIILFVIVIGILLFAFYQMRDSQTNCSSNPIYELKQEGRDIVWSFFSQKPSEEFAVKFYANRESFDKGIPLSTSSVRAAVSPTGQGTARKTKVTGATMATITPRNCPNQPSIIVYE